MKIELVSLGNVEDTVLENISSQILETFEKIDRWEVKDLEIPERSYKSERNQYRADLILDSVSSNLPGKRGKILAITDKDLFARGLNFVFGQARKPGRAGIISVHRLNPEFYGQPRDQELYIFRAKKEAVHEIGHLSGLEHCGNRECVMSFSNSIRDVDRKGPSLCEKCGKKLNQAT